jgi:D-proline reductase (dithiol) PrdB
MARLSDLKLKYRLYMQAYAYRHIDWRPGAQLRKPLAASKIAVVTSAAFYSAGQEAFDPTVHGGDYSYRELQREGVIGEVAKRHYSFMGSITAPARLVQMTAPEIANKLTEVGADAVLLTPV